MQCKNCKAKVARGSSFCGRCGSPLESRGLPGSAIAVAIAVVSLAIAVVALVLVLQNRNVDDLSRGPQEGTNTLTAGKASLDYPTSWGEPEPSAEGAKVLGMEFEEAQFVRMDEDNWIEVAAHPKTQQSWNELKELVLSNNVELSDYLGTKDAEIEVSETQQGDSECVQVDALFYRDNQGQTASAQSGSRTGKCRLIAVFMGSNDLVSECVVGMWSADSLPQASEDEFLSVLRTVVHPVESDVEKRPSSESPVDSSDNQKAAYGFLATWFGDYEAGEDGFVLSDHAANERCRTLISESSALHREFFSSEGEDGSPQRFLKSPLGAHAVFFDAVLQPQEDGKLLAAVVCNEVDSDRLDKDAYERLLVSHLVEWWLVGLDDKGLVTSLERAEAPSGGDLWFESAAEGVGVSTSSYPCLEVSRIDDQRNMLVMEGYARIATTRDGLIKDTGFVDGPKKWELPLSDNPGFVGIGVELSGDPAMLPRDEFARALESSKLTFDVRVVNGKAVYLSLSS